jgi:hypothetical protein
VTGRPRAQRLAERLIRRACRHLPDDMRDERYREWAAELPAILHDPDIRFALLRSARALIYAAGISRSTRHPHRAAGRPPKNTRRPAIVARPDSVLPARPDVPVLPAIAGVGIWLGLVVLIVSLITIFQPRGLWPLIPVFVVAAAFVAFCLTDLARADEVRYLPKWVWALVCFISIPLGGIIYLTVGKVRRPRAVPSDSPKT